MRIAMIDDQKTDLDYLHNSLLLWANQNNIPLIPAPVMFHSGEEFLAGFQQNQYDIIFLDIYMGGMTGMDTARQIRTIDTKCHLIFTTSAVEFAVESYDVASSYYLVKPYSQEKLTLALSRCKTSIIEQAQSIKVPGTKGETQLPLHFITYSECVNRKIVVHLKDQTEITVLMNQKDWIDILLQYPYFCDCFRGIVVNLEHVDKLLEDSFLISSGLSLPISRLKYREVREQFLQFSYNKARGGSKFL